MPIFEYRCAACDTRFEQFVQGSRTPECPSCHGTQLEKQLSVFAVSAKGSSSHVPMPASACGACCDPRGPGACCMN
jgi:putative FmdB family regulatory protein